MYPTKTESVTTPLRRAKTSSKSTSVTPALCAEMYFYKDKESGKKRVQLYSFYVDIQHLKNCAKDGLLDHYGNGITLFAKEMDKDLWEMAKIFTKNGIKVTIK